jgi:glycosyltransferase involved in cell wall biosynthesis
MCDTESEEVCKKLELRFGKDFKWYKLESAGLAVARNFGASVCRSPFIRFHDDDDVISYPTVKKLSRLHCDKPEAVILTKTIMDTNFDRPFMRFLTSDPGYVFNYKAIAVRTELQFDSFWGGRTSMPIEIFGDHQFDPDFVFGCEDVEFGYRVLGSKWKLFYEPSLTATQIRDISVPNFVLRTVNQGYSQFLVAQKHPTGPINDWAMEKSIDLNLSRFDSYLIQLSSLLKEAIRYDCSQSAFDKVFGRDFLECAKWIWVNLYKSAKTVGFMACASGYNRNEFIDNKLKPALRTS